MWRVSGWRSNLVSRTVSPMPVGRRRVRPVATAALAALALVVAACGGPAPTVDTPAVPAASVAAPTNSAPAATPGASSTPPSVSGWVRAASIEQPTGFMTAQTGVVITRGCAPCHPAIDSLMTGVADGPAGLVTVGWILQDFSAAFWHSSDASTWTFSGGFPTETLLAAVAADDQRYVAVGRSGDAIMAWTSTDAATWTQVHSPAFAGPPLRFTSVAAWKGGFVAGGYAGTEFFSANAALWTSPDGLSWTRAADTPSFHDARVWGVAPGGPGLVAVGQTGPADAPGPVIVWTSPDGRSWTPVADSPIFQGGRIRAIASVPSIGLVAVGEDLAGDTGIVWVSPDGRTWKRAPADPTFGRPGIQVRIYTVTAGPNGVVAAGTLDAGVQYGEAVVWTSPDGYAWTRAPDGPEFLDTEMTGSTRWDDRVVAIGDRGAPDAYQATAWLSPSGVGR